MARDTNDIAASHARLERLERLAVRMDSAMRIPGTGIRFGLDSVLGLVPGVGDVLALVPGAWIVLESHRAGAPPRLLARQGVNIAVDTVIGAIPLIGDLFDVGFKANRRNVAMLRAHIHGTGTGTGTSSGAGDGTGGRPA